MTALDTLTRGDVEWVHYRARLYSWDHPWLEDELAGRVLLDLVRRPDLTDNHPLSQAVNMLMKSRLLDLLKQRQQNPTDPQELSDQLPPVEMDADEHEWDQLYRGLVEKVGDRSARAAIMLARYGYDHREIGARLGVSRFAVSRDITLVRIALSQ